jgi:hypothetical protein
MGLGFYIRKGCTEGTDKWSGAESLKVGKWHHLVWTFDNSTMTMFIDGNKSGTMTDSTGILKNKAYKNMYIVNSVEQFDKDIGVAWFRIYDYVMSDSDIKTDRRNGFSSSKLFPVSKDSGWV